MTKRLKKRDAVCMGINYIYSALVAPYMVNEKTCVYIAVWYNMVCMINS